MRVGLLDTSVPNRKRDWEDNPSQNSSLLRGQGQLIFATSVILQKQILLLTLSFSLQTGERDVAGLSGCCPTAGLSVSLQSITVLGNVTG